MTFLYRNTISVRRAKAKTPTVGDRGVSGHRGPVDEDVVLAGPIRCSIQEEGAKSASRTRLPTDPKEPEWRIMIPKSAGLADGAIKRGDVAVDQHGNRYQVTAPIATSLGTELTCIWLEP